MSGRLGFVFFSTSVVAVVVHRVFVLNALTLFIHPCPRELDRRYQERVFVVDNLDSIAREEFHKTTPVCTRALFLNFINNKITRNASKFRKICANANIQFAKTIFLDF